MFVPFFPGKEADFAFPGVEAEMGRFLFMGFDTGFEATDLDALPALGAMLPGSPTTFGPGFEAAALDALLARGSLHPGSAIT